MKIRFTMFALENTILSRLNFNIIYRGKRTSTKKFAEVKARKVRQQYNRRIMETYNLNIKNVKYRVASRMIRALVFKKSVQRNKTRQTAQNNRLLEFSVRDFNELLDLPKDHHRFVAFLKDIKAGISRRLSKYMIKRIRRTMKYLLYKAELQHKAFQLAKVNSSLEAGVNFGSLPNFEDSIVKVSTTFDELGEQDFDQELINPKIDSNIQMDSQPIESTEIDNPAFNSQVSENAVAEPKSSAVNISYPAATTEPKLIEVAENRLYTTINTISRSSDIFFISRFIDYKITDYITLKAFLNKAIYCGVKINTPIIYIVDASIKYSESEFDKLKDTIPSASIRKNGGCYVKTSPDAFLEYIVNFPADALTDTIFIFYLLPFNIFEFCKAKGVILSQGYQNKREYLSTNEFKLAIFLDKAGYNLHGVHESSLIAYQSDTNISPKTKLGKTKGSANHLITGKAIPLKTNVKWV